MINNLDKTKEVKEMIQVDQLIRQGVLQIGQKAKGNPERLDKPNFCLGIANKDYPAMTPFFWNEVFKQLGFERRNIRLFGDPEKIELIFQVFKADRRYIGGDVGVGFKDK